MEILSFITFFLLTLLIPTFFISLINPRLLKLDTRKKSIKIHLATSSTLFVILVISALLSDNPDKKIVKLLNLQSRMLFRKA